MSSALPNLFGVVTAIAALAIMSARATTNLKVWAIPTPRLTPILAA